VATLASVHLDALLDLHRPAGLEHVAVALHEHRRQLGREEVGVAPADDRDAVGGADAGVLQVREQVAIVAVLGPDHER
jgi:hypothetical protein